MQQERVNLASPMTAGKIPRILTSSQVGEAWLKVPAHMSKALIGPSGDNVKLLHQVTGCKIAVDFETPSTDGMQIVRLYGIAWQREQAKGLLLQQCEAVNKAHMLRYDEAAGSSIYAAVKVAMTSAGIEGFEEPMEIARIRFSIINFANSSAEGIDVSGQTVSLDGIVYSICRNFFTSVCQAYHKRPWLSLIDFQLVLEAGIKELVPEQLLGLVTGEKLDELILEFHDLSFEEQRPLPMMWDTVQQHVHGPTMKAYKALVIGRSQALLPGFDEVSGMARAEAFLQAWILVTLKQLTDAGGGSPHLIVPKEKVIEIMLTMLALSNDTGASNALPARWAMDAVMTQSGWELILEAAYELAAASLAARKEVGKGGRYQDSDEIKDLCNKRKQEKDTGERSRINREILQMRKMERGAFSEGNRSQAEMMAVAQAKRFKPKKSVLLLLAAKADEAAPKPRPSCRPDLACQRLPMLDEPSGERFFPSLPSAS